MITRIVRGTLWLAAAAAAVAYLVLAIGRIAYPLELDPIEGALQEHALRLAHHQPLYLEPAPGASHSLMPGFPLLVSLLVSVFGPHLWEPRVISLLASLGAAALVTIIVRAETESWTLGVSAGGLMLTGCGLMVGRAEVAHPETLTLVLVLAGYLALRNVPGVAGALLAGLPLAAACFTQAMAVWFTAGAIFYLAFEDRARFATLTLGVALLLGSGYVLVSQLLGPWFNYYVWDVPVSSLKFDPARLLQYVGDQLLGKLGVLTLAAVLSFALPTRPWRGPTGLWMCLGIATLGAGLLATQGARTGPHSLAPTVVALALIGPISIQRVTRHLSAWPGSSRLGGQGVVLAALALQFIMFGSSVSATLKPPDAGPVEPERVLPTEREPETPISDGAAAAPTPAPSDSVR